jgi:hypothetical protein
MKQKPMISALFVPDIFLRTLSSNTEMTLFHYGEAEFPHHYETWARIIVFYVLIIGFLGRNWERLKKTTTLLSNDIVNFG